MTRNSKALTVFFFAALVLSPPQSAVSSAIQSPNFVPRSSRRSPDRTPASPPTSSKSEHLPYLNASCQGQQATEPSSFSPTASDLLIQQAEERFRNGKKVLSGPRFRPCARSEFDAAIDLMLRASDNPDRPQAVRIEAGRHGGYHSPRRSCRDGRGGRGRSAGFRQSAAGRHRHHDLPGRSADQGQGSDAKSN